MKLIYDKETDTLSIILRKGNVAESDEARPGLILDYDKSGRLLSLEMLDASEQIEGPQTVEFALASEEQQQLETQTMGLDIVEFVMEVEERFNLHISDADAQQLMTPRRLIDYVHAHVRHASDGYCMSQRAFYELRRVLTDRLDLPRSSIRRRTRVLCVLPRQGRAEVWESLRQDLAMSKRWWPVLPEKQWFPGWFPLHLGALTRALVVHTPMALPKAGEAWTKPQVAKAVYDLICSNFGLDISHYSDDAHFTEDMGID